VRYLFTLIFLFGCAPSSDMRFEPANGFFDEYTREFEDLYGQDIGFVEFGFAAFDDRYAQCNRLANFGQVLVDKERWDDLCELQKRAVIFHELGHCVLHREHSGEDSYMYESIRSCEFYEGNKDGLDFELFN